MLPQRCLSRVRADHRPGCGVCSSTRRRRSTGIVSVHLMAHLWWEESRRDFLDLHARMINERWVREVDTVYGVAARRFLPEHGEF